MKRNVPKSAGCMDNLKISGKQPSKRFQGYGHQGAQKQESENKEED